MTDRNLLLRYGDLLDEGDDPALFTAVRAIEQAYPSVQPPTDVVDRIRASSAYASIDEVPPRRRGSRDKRFLGLRRPVRRSVALATAAALTVATLGGAGYAMHVLGGGYRPHVVLSCSGFGARWSVSGVGVRNMSPQRFVASGGHLIPNWREPVSRLQRPQFWRTPDNADIVDTCEGGTATQEEIGTNQRDATQLFAISVVPMWESNRKVLVPDLRLPPGCTPKPTTSPIKTPDGRRIAQLARIPGNLSRSVSVIFPPCDMPKRAAGGLPPPSKQIGFRILSQVQYRGRAGSVVIVTARPTPAAAHRGLDLGPSAGTLPDGTRVWGVLCSRLCERLHRSQHTRSTNDIRWMKGHLIVSMSGDVPVKELMALARDVGLK